MPEVHCVAVQYILRGSSSVVCCGVQKTKKQCQRGKKNKYKKTGTSFRQSALNSIEHTSVWLHCLLAASARRGDLVIAQSAHMGCPLAESTLQPVRLCGGVTPYRSDLKECCRSQRRI